LSDRESLRAILDEADACRLAFAVGDMPYIVTLNFGYEWKDELPRLFFHCATEGRKLDMMRANPRVCFELDVGHELVTGPAPCDYGMKYASLVGYGKLRELVDEVERLRSLDILLRHYGWRGEASPDNKSMHSTCVLDLQVEELCGKRRR
jgi:nitroimidazol reductase NimA-like FMN-containing flavoprotein (pyridoxamine 5'-phosphate oxidase superfamily)